jgi:TRAP-type C4-dicarboxylate transport system substrate-binding protein
MVLKANLFSKIILLLLLSVGSLPTYAKEIYTLKFALLTPSGTAWMNVIDAWADEVYVKSNGRIKFKIYPGGVMGDEPDVLRKIRSNQLQGAFFTGYGIGRIYSPARVLEMPFLFKNTDESDYVREKLMADIEAGFRNKGFELLGWPEVGFIHFFSKKPITSLADVRKRRVWIWSGDPMGEALTEVAGISPVPLSIMDVYTQLSAKHGSIDTVFNSPFGALAMQWHTKVKYASILPATNAIGGLIVSHRFFNKLPADLQQLLRDSGKKAGEEINFISRRDNYKSIALLKQSGIEFMWDWNENEMQEMLNIRDRAAVKLAAMNYIPAEYFQRTRKMLKKYRLRQHNNPSLH